MRTVTSDQSGFTLIELLTTMTVGMVVLMAGFLLLDRATSASVEIADRQDAVQRARVAMERITRQLRSQVCLGDETEPITYGDEDQIVFYTDLGAGSLSGDTVERRRLGYVEGPGGARIVQDVFARQSGTYPDIVFAELPTKSNVLLSPAGRLLDDGVERPFLRYFAFRDGGAPGDLEQLPVPLSADDASRTVLVKVGFSSVPDRATRRDRNAAGMESDVYVRLADPSRPLEGPRCL